MCILYVLLFLLLFFLICYVYLIYLWVWEMNNKIWKIIIKIDNSCNDLLMWYRMVVMFYYRK